MKKALTILLLCKMCIISTSLSAQIDYRNASQSVAYFEMLGQGGLATLNYDQRFTKSTNGPGFRVGIGYINVGKFSGYTLPVGLNYLEGGNSKYLELGLGLTYGKMGIIDKFDNEPRLAANLFVGFRYQPEEPGLNIRVGISAFYGNIKKPDKENEGFFIPLPGISLGYTFN